MVKLSKIETLSGMTVRLREAMAVRGVTIRALSKESGVPYRSLQNYLRGEHVMSIHALKKIVDALRISSDWVPSGHAASFDDEVLADSLTVVEDVRVLSDYKVTIEEGAKMFIKFYQKFYSEKLRPDRGAVAAVDVETSASDNSDNGN